MFKLSVSICLLFFSLSNEHLLALDLSKLFTKDQNEIYEIEFIVSNYHLQDFKDLCKITSKFPDIIERARKLKLFHVAQKLRECLDKNPVLPLATFKPIETSPLY